MRLSRACDGGSTGRQTWSCRRPPMYPLVIRNFADSKSFPFFFFAMDSIITTLGSEAAWEEFLAYRLRKGRLSWHDFDEADAFVENKGYLALAQQLDQGQSLGIPNKSIINKMGTGKKRVVYSFGHNEMLMLKLLAYLLYRYDDCFASNCYAFRRGRDAHDGIKSLNRGLKGHPMWAYKVDIHDYFNSIPIDLLIPMLEEILVDDPQLCQFFQTMLTNNKVLYNGQVTEERHGVMAGIPTAPFLANVYLNKVDHHFLEAGVLYARYSDDIILFAPDEATLNQHKAVLLGFLNELRLEVNPDKEHIFSPDQAYEFLGFSCHGNDIDIAHSTLEKMKGKIRRKARSLKRWSERNDIDPQRSMKALIRYFNRKFFESNDPETLTWTRWFFPMITQTDGLMEIDHYLQQNIRYLSTGRHCKANFQVSYEQLKQLGYKTLVNEFHHFKEARSI